MASLASARDAEDAEADYAHISASQEELLARARFLTVDSEEEEAEVFSTPPLTHQDPQRQGKQEQDPQRQGEECIAMCSMPFTQPPSPSPSPAPSPPSKSPSPERVNLKPRKRVCTRKVRRANKLRTPTPSPSPTRSRSPELDPLARAVLMIPTAPSTITGHEDILELARSRGIF